MILGNVRLASGDGPVNIGIEDGKIASLNAGNGPQFTFSNAIAFPGLINSHDHLDFNLFPQLGDKIYRNYVEWGEYIQENYKVEIDAVLAVPLHLRSQWGVYKNLLCGVTTVVNHGVPLSIDNELITVLNNFQNLHSVALEKNWKLRLNNPLRLKTPVVIHIGEGTDIGSFTEINTLLRWAFIKRDIIGVHGVAMKASQAAGFKALVWCPQTNYFLLNKTAHIDQLKHHTQILFGTDSTLTSDWNIWDHIRMAQKTSLLSDDELYDSLTTSPAKIWKLNSGRLTPGKNADVVIAKDRGGFFATDAEDILMVVQQGHIRLFDEEMYEQVANSGVDLNAYSKIYLGSNCKYVQGDLPGLIKQVKQYQPGAVLPVSTHQAEAVHS